jgi:hypothetical protein
VFVCCTWQPRGRWRTNDCSWRRATARRKRFISFILLSEIFVSGKNGSKGKTSVVLICITRHTSTAAGVHTRRPCLVLHGQPDIHGLQ